MTETITMPKLYTNREVADLMGCSPEYVRKLKSTRKDELDGLWQVSETDKETYWTEEGLNVLASMMSTSQAKSFCAGALARRTQEAIAITRSETSSEAIATNDSNLYQNNVDQSSTRTGHETAVYTINQGRYSQLPEKIGGAIAGQMINDGAVKRIDAAVVSHLLRELNLGDDIDVEALLGS